MSNRADGQLFSTSASASLKRKLAISGLSRKRASYSATRIFNLNGCKMAMTPAYIMLSEKGVRMRFKIAA